MLHRNFLICWSLLLLVSLTSSCSWRPEKETVTVTKIADDEEPKYSVCIMQGLDMEQRKVA